LTFVTTFFKGADACGPAAHEINEQSVYDLKHTHNNTPFASIEVMNP
jgi:hypothetical protein